MAKQNSMTGEDLGKKLLQSVQEMNARNAAYHACIAKRGGGSST